MKSKFIKRSLWICHRENLAIWKLWSLDYDGSLRLYLLSTTVFKKLMTRLKCGYSNVLWCNQTDLVNFMSLIWVLWPNRFCMSCQRQCYQRISRFNTEIRNRYGKVVSCSDIPLFSLLGFILFLKMSEKGGRYVYEK